MLKKSKKEEMIKELETAVSKSESVVFVNFHGLNVSDETHLRRDLRNQEIGYKVSRKTLLRRALTGKAEGEIPELPGEVAIVYIPELPGEVAIVYSKDATSSPREIYNFQKTHKDILSILGGIFEGKFIGAERMMEIAMIPSREVLYAQFVNLINSPIQRFAVVLGEIAKTK